MSHPTLPVVPASHLARVRELMKDGRRKLLGLVGPPGAGKSTLAFALQQTFADLSQVVPMDGFHLPNVELNGLALPGGKGSPATSASAGYWARLRRLLHQAAE